MRCWKAAKFLHDFFWNWKKHIFYVHRIGETHTKERVKEREREWKRVRERVRKGERECACVCVCVCVCVREKLNWINPGRKGNVMCQIVNLTRKKINFFSHFLLFRFFLCFSVVEKLKTRKEPLTRSAKYNYLLASEEEKQQQKNELIVLTVIQLSFQFQWVVSVGFFVAERTRKWSFPVWRRLIVELIIAPSNA